MFKRFRGHTPQYPSSKDLQWDKRICIIKVPHLILIQVDQGRTWRNNFISANTWVIHKIHKNSNPRLELLGPWPPEPVKMDLSPLNMFYFASWHDMKFYQ